MENKNKRKKLTLSVSGSLKKPQQKIDLAKTQDKNSVVVDKKNTRFQKPRVDYSKFKPNNNKSSVVNKTSSTKSPIPSKDFEKRKLAEQRATKRLKGEPTNEKDFKNKSSGKKREYKLTLSRALNDDVQFKGRSLASIKRAKQKENRLSSTQQGQESSKSIIREVNIPEVITIRELANRMAEQSSNIIKHLLGMGVTATINHSIDADTAEYLVKEFGHKAVREEKIDIDIKNVAKSQSAE